MSKQPTVLKKRTISDPSFQNSKRDNGDDDDDDGNDDDDDGNDDDGGIQKNNNTNTKEPPRTSVRKICVEEENCQKESGQNY